MLVTCGFLRFHPPIKLIFFHKILMQFFQSVRLNYNNFYFNSKECLYGGQLPKFLHIGKLHRIFIVHPILMCFLLLLNGLCYVLSVVCQQFPISFRNNVLFVLMLVSSYQLNTACQIICIRKQQHRYKAYSARTNSSIYSSNQSRRK